jgi:hypothetical protein
MMLAQAHSLKPDICSSKRSLSTGLQNSRHRFDKCKQRKYDIVTSSPVAWHEKPPGLIDRAAAIIALSSSI